MRKLIMYLLCLLAIAGCASGGDDEPLPTVMNLADASDMPATDETTVSASEDDTPPTDSAVDNAAASPTVTNPVSATPSLTQTPATIESTASSTPSPPAQASATPEPSTPTVIIIEPVRLSTVTPIPVGADVIPPPIPVVAADVVINEVEFQAALATRLPAIPEIQSVQVDFVADEGLNIRMTAAGGEVIVTGDVAIGFQLSGGLAAISIQNISVGSGDVRQSFIQVAQDQLFTAVIETFDGLLTEKLGPDHDLEQLSFTDDTMQLMLLIPE